MQWIGFEVNIGPSQGECVDRQSHWERDVSSDEFKLPDIEVLRLIHFGGEYLPALDSLTSKRTMVPVVRFVMVAQGCRSKIDAPSYL